MTRMFGAVLSSLAECSSSHAAHYEGISLRTAATLDIVTDALSKSRQAEIGTLALTYF